MTGDAVAGPRTSSRLTAPLVACLRFYQAAVSPLLGPRCRFEPSCSSYAVEALQVHGPLRGVALALWRLLRCQPLSRGGYDPVPPRPGGARARRAAGDDGHPHDSQPHHHYPRDSGASVTAGLPSRGARPC